MILLTSNNIDYGSLSPGSAFLYFDLIIWISLFIGIWALFVFFRMTVTHQTLNQHRYRAKVIVYKLVLLFSNIEGKIKKKWISMYCEKWDYLPLHQIQDLLLICLELMVWSLAWVDWLHQEQWVTLSNQFWLAFKAWFWALLL